ncbi:MAG TPA: hypothetical protein DHU96_32150, partial [Actinobacteria bacterium]|nr:hypothetical protein [Actinomycetota bacterium]
VAWRYMGVHGLLFLVGGTWLAVEAYRRLPFVRAAARSLRPSLREFTRLGLLTVPTGLVLAVLALWGALHVIGG